MKKCTPPLTDHVRERMSERDFAPQDIDFAIEHGRSYRAHDGAIVRYVDALTATSLYRKGSAICRTALGLAVILASPIGPVLTAYRTPKARNTWSLLDE